MQIQKVYAFVFSKLANNWVYEVFIILQPSYSQANFFSAHPTTLKTYFRSPEWMNKRMNGRNISNYIGVLVILMVLAANCACFRFYCISCTHSFTVPFVSFSSVYSFFIIIFYVCSARSFAPPSFTLEVFTLKRWKGLPMIWSYTKWANFEYSIQCHLRLFFFN